MSLTTAWIIAEAVLALLVGLLRSGWPGQAAMPCP
jgi:hypothetical protein